MGFIKVYIKMTTSVRFCLPHDLLVSIDLELNTLTTGFLHVTAPVIFDSV